jgi:methylated-DNA-[protein]-cysteine S-methyltransferase
MVGYFEGPLGGLWITADEEAITEISWVPVGTPDDLVETPLLREAARQLEEYFAGRRTEFDLPLRAVGTPFRQRVWEALRAIPYGETRTYGDIAHACVSDLAGARGDARAWARAVGGACHNNPLSIVVPCHRVVGTSGLTGYAGGLDKKKFLLELEQGRACF